MLSLFPTSDIILELWYLLNLGTYGGVVEVVDTSVVPASVMLFTKTKIRCTVVVMNKNYSYKSQNFMYLVAFSDKQISMLSCRECPTFHHLSHQHSFLCACH